MKAVQLGRAGGRNSDLPRGDQNVCFNFIIVFFIVVVVVVFVFFLKENHQCRFQRRDKVREIMVLKRTIKLLEFLEMRLERCCALAILTAS